jgi:enediyne biosynthesis protein E4
MYRPTFFLSFIYCCCLSFSGCRQQGAPEGGFETLNHHKTGLHFVNQLTSSAEFNMFKYMYFYNGAGVGTGDFNNDGRVDIFLAGNQVHNRMYLNNGNMTFKDVTDKAKIPHDGSWSTGVSVVDINNDSLLDIYICKVSRFESLQGQNQLLICDYIGEDGIPVYTDKAGEYGLAFSGFSTQAAFLDYDLDGDLDMYLLNHSVHQNGTFAERKKFLGTYHPLSGDRMYRNDDNKFIDVTKSTGINSSAIGYGLGICVSDINLDGYPDIYVGNDFHENDYLYINRRDGSFSEELTNSMMHTSQFSMGVDIADINNDAFPEIITMDMLPSDPYILKRSLGEDEYNIFNMKISYGYNHQYAKNCLQLNRKNGLFSEVAMYAGVYATDWSWAPLWLDFDNDGLKDLFVSNGIPKRLNDIDYVNYISNRDIQEKIKTTGLEEKEMAIINRFPELRLPNKFYKNVTNAVFTDMADQIEDEEPAFSNGAAYADFDNDGDLDVLVNNIDESPLLYRNKTNDEVAKRSIKVALKGPEKNINAIGSKLLVYTGNSIRTYEKYPVHGFQSSMEAALTIGLHNVTVDSMVVVWPDRTSQRIALNKESGDITLAYRQGLPTFDYALINNYEENKTIAAHDISADVALNYVHRENPFVEFDREPLIPFMVSREGPALAVADINKDGLDDVFIGSSKGNKSGVFIQSGSGQFNRSDQPDLDEDSTYEDVDACWVDINNDSFIDLVVASGGNEYYGEDTILQSRAYLNNGKGQLKKLPKAFEGIYMTASCVKPFDFNNDGYPDLFIGGRAVAWEYGEVPVSYLLENDRKGHFKNVTTNYSKELSQVGIVKDADWCDLDGDRDMDLVVALEWDGIVAFLNEGRGFTKRVLFDRKGFWNFTLPYDVDNDGDLDLLAGNMGLNNRLKASAEQPVKLYLNDFDNNGRKEQLLTHYVNDREIPFANKMELEKQMPFLKKKFLYAEDFAKATLTELFSRKKLNTASLLTADYFSSTILINEGDMKFTAKPLPWLAQLSPLKDAVIVNANGDKLPDILLAANFYENNIQMGRYDADHGTVLVNQGNGFFTCSNVNGISIKGEVRHIRKITIAGKEAFIMAKNNDTTKVIHFSN